MMPVRSALARRLQTLTEIIGTRGTMRSQKGRVQQPWPNQ